MLQSTNVGTRIAEARKKMGLSQADIAQRVAISPQAVGKWERGESMPDIITLNRLAEIFGVDLNYFSDGHTDVETATNATLDPLPETTDDSAGPGKRADWNWDMSRGNWTDADFSGLKNLSEKFSSSNIRNCLFRNSDLSGLLLGRNNIELCDFSGADFRNSKIQSSNLGKNRFNACSFIDAECFKSNIEQCDFSGADWSGAEILECNLESNTVTEAHWKFTRFRRTNISNMTFSGDFEDCHFEHCSFYNVTFEGVNFRNTFFKYNDRFKKVRFGHCTADNITYAFLKNNQATLSGITLRS
ncbi:MAG: helix-turn-helix domain-containing protein [Chitinophagaceae bacterium]